MIRPLSRSATEEVAVGSVTLDDVGDMVETKQALTEAVLWPLQHPDTFARLGVEPPRGVLLYGPPGCGKTFVVRALASTGRLSVHAVKGAELMDKWVGSSEKAVRELFRRARDSAPSLVFLDEIDALAPRRGQSFDSGVTDRVVAALLTELDGIDPLRDVVVLGATNRPDLIDPALLRPGRLEKLVFVEPPGRRCAPRDPAHLGQVDPAERRRRPRRAGRRTRRLQRGRLRGTAARGGADRDAPLDRRRRRHGRRRRQGPRDRAAIAGSRPGGLAARVRQSSLAPPEPTPRRRPQASAASARRERGAGRRRKAGRQPLARRRQRTARSLRPNSCRAKVPTRSISGRVHGGKRLARMRYRARRRADHPAGSSTTAGRPRGVRA